MWPVTKQFTVVALLKAFYDEDSSEKSIQKKLQSPIERFFEKDHSIWGGDMPEWAREVTVHHLLTHSSGIPNWTNLPEFKVRCHTLSEVSEMVSLFKNKNLEFPSGSQFAYCNSGYLLLGELVQEITGLSLGQCMEKSFFEPLKMTSTVYAEKGTVLDLKKSDLRFENLARGYGVSLVERELSLLEVDPYELMEVPRGGGSIVSSAPDLLKWNQGLHNGNIIPEFLLNVMLEPYMKDLPLPWGQLGENYGYGIALTNSPEVGPVYCHHGGIRGFRSGLTYVPSHKLSIVCLTNIEEGDREESKSEYNLLSIEKIILDKLLIFKCRSHYALS